MIAAALSIQDPRERPVEQRARRPTSCTRASATRRSDFLTWLNLWRYLRDAAEGAVGSSAFRRMCREEHLNYLRVREWQDFESQLRQVAKQVGLKIGPRHGRGRRTDEDGIHQALLSGLLSHIGLLEERDRRPSAATSEYLGARSAGSRSSPAAGCSRAPARRRDGRRAGRDLRALGAAERRDRARSGPSGSAAHLVKRTYSEPHWSQEARVRDGPRARHPVRRPAGRRPARPATAGSTRRWPASCSSGTPSCYGEWPTRHRFFETNRRLLEEAEELEHRARRRDIVVDEHTLFDFYDARIPAEVVCGAHFDTWWKQERRDATRPAHLRPGDAGPRDGRARCARPTSRDAWQAEGLTFPLQLPLRAGRARATA